MELTKRRLQILCAVIEEYIDLAQPVGSVVLSQRRDLKVSAATLRNEMAALEKLGLLEKPHSSAGRRPTDSAYRLYVGNMLHLHPLSDEELEELVNSFNTPMDEVREVCSTAARALSRLTGCIAIVAAPALGETVLRKVQLIRYGNGRIMALLVADTGCVQQIVLSMQQALSDDDLLELSALLSRAVDGMQYSAAGDTIDALAENVPEGYEDVIRELGAAINRNKDEIDLFLDGRQNIWTYPEYQNWEKAKQFFALLDTREWLESMLGSTPDAEFVWRFGREVNNTLPDLCVVTGTYRTGVGSEAAFGVVAPARMNYRRILPILRDVGARMSAALRRLTAAK